MVKKTMEDVVVHRAEPPEYSREYGKATSVTTRQIAQEDDRIEHNPFFEKPRQTFQAPQEKKPRSKVLLWTITILGVFGLVFLVFSYFSSATVEITPLAYHGHVDLDFIAPKQAVNTLVGEQTLAFHFVSLTEEKSVDVPTTAEQTIQKKASGRVVIYNAYSKDSQRLIKNTRLESSDHKIFRIADGVVVPGAKYVAGKLSQPGSVEVVAYADVAGKEYNIGLGDFTIPGFKGDPRYTKFSARSKADSPIAGGFSGTVKVPSDADVQKAQSDIKDSLKATAIEKARALIPDGMTFFPGSTVLKFEEVAPDYTAEDTAKVSVRAIASVFFFETAALTQKIAQVSLADYQGNQVILTNLPALTFTFLDPVNNVVLSDISQLHFHITGDTSFVGKIDTQQIRTSLAGKDKKDFAKIIVGEHNVGKADATIRPMWRTTFPVDPSKISVNILEQ